MLKMVILKEPENGNRRKTVRLVLSPHVVEWRRVEQKDSSKQQWGEGDGGLNRVKSITRQEDTEQTLRFLCVYPPERGMQER